MRARVTTATSSSITGQFAIGVDLLQVIAEAPRARESPCVERPVMDKIEEFDLQMRQADGVATVRSLAGFVKQVTQAFAENFVKWRALPEERRRSRKAWVSRRGLATS